MLKKYILIAASLLMLTGGFLGAQAGDLRVAHAEPVAQRVAFVRPELYRGRAA